MTQQALIPQEVNTIPITNFGGRLTRFVNGDLNSGMAKFTSSFGYDPFAKPGNLTWLEQPTSILSSTTDLILAAKVLGGSSPKVYAIAKTGNLYGITPNSIGNPPNPNLDSASILGTVSANSPTFVFGASMEFFQATSKLYVGNDGQVNSIGTDGSGDVKVGGAGYKASSYRPLKQFAGKLLFGNGNTIGVIDSTGTVTSSIIGTGQGNLYSELNPPLPVQANVQDIDISQDGNYALVTASLNPNEAVGNINNDTVAGSASDGFIFRWNGSDVTYTAANTIPSYAVTALQSFLDNETFFSNDSFGGVFSAGQEKILSLPGNKSPSPNATLANGNFVSWITPEVTAAGTGINASLYYYGQLDAENPKGLYRLLRYTPMVQSFVYQTPLNILTNNKYSAINTASTGVNVLSYGKHYFSVWEVGSSGGGTTYLLYRFLVTSTGTGLPQLGVYETQTQLFSKRIAVKQIRVYTEPTVTGNGFQLDMIGSDGNVVTDGTYSYTFAAGSDETRLQGALERINFNPNAKTGYSLGIRLTNTGTTNMTIKKVEVDYSFSGK